MSKAKRSKRNQTLLRIHREHAGVYSRVAERLGVDASLVSRVASGDRTNEAVLKALVKELGSLTSPAA
jgi:transcriptional regulator with XRE-family HTH domain